MSRWKQQIDNELGNEVKFSLALQQKILQKAEAKKKHNLTMPVTLIGICFVALLLFLTTPTQLQQEQPTNSSPITLMNIMKEDRIKTVYMSYYTSYKPEFFARDNTLALGIRKIDKKDISKVEQLLKNSRLSGNLYIHPVWGPTYSDGNDFIIEFESGLKKKIRVETQFLDDSFYVQDEGVEFSFFDFETNLYYTTKVDEGDLLLKYKESLDWSIIVFFILMFISYWLISVNLKKRAPKSIKIYLQFVVLTIVVAILFTQNIVLTIWLPVSYLLIRAWARYFHLRNENYAAEMLRKMKLSTILLSIMWLVVFIQQLLGGI